MPTDTSFSKPLAVLLLDGWGISFITQGNAIKVADTPTMDMFAASYPTASLHAASTEVGLPWGEVGNSETGHRNIGAGSIQYQILSKIDTSIAKGSFYANPEILGAIEHAKKHSSSLHLMGMLSPGGVHSHINHLFALLDLCKQQGLREHVYIHIFTDGRDTLPQSALVYLESLEDTIKQHAIGTIASVTGRFYAMDRNKNWDRTEAVYAMLTGSGRMAGAPSPKQAIQQSYDQGIHDEMIPPTAITKGGKEVASIQDKDSVIFFNFRPDRAIQLTQAFSQPEKVGFSAKRFTDLYFCSMSRYDAKLPVHFAFEEDIAQYPLARLISDAGLTQLHIAETEKYAHVTYYLNVGHTETYPGEDHILIPSSNTANFAHKPHMQAQAITDTVIQALQASVHDVYFVNFANADMVGHTGDFDAAVSACSFVDTCIHQIYTSVIKANGTLLVTADHGNAEEMIHPDTNAKETDHTNNPVPFHIIAKHVRRSSPRSEDDVVNIFSEPIGMLSDIAPTVLDILDIEQHPSMTGVSLLTSLR